MSENSQEQTLEGLRHEYSELNQNFRHYSALRFAILTVFFAVEGGLLSFAFNITQTTPGIINFMAKIGGVLVTLLFFMLEILVQRYLSHFSKVAAQLEKSLGYSHLSTRPKSQVIKTQHATWTLFVLVILFWLYVLLFL